MSYNNRSWYGNRGNSGGIGTQQGRGNDDNPATQTILTSGKRMVIINAYSRGDGSRVAQCSFCEIGTIPDAVSEMGDTRLYGVQKERGIMTVPEALSAAEQWLSGTDTKSAIL